MQVEKVAFPVISSHLKFPSREQHFFSKFFMEFQIHTYLTITDEVMQPEVLADSVGLVA